MNKNYDQNLIPGNPKKYKNRPTWFTLQIFYNVDKPITISDIAKGMDVSYNHAWQYINNLLKTKKIELVSKTDTYPKKFKITEWGIKYVEWRKNKNNS